MNRNPEVDQWLDEANHPLESTMRRARDIILGADGRVTESVKWKTPTFAYKRNIANFNPSKNLVSIMFHRGSEIPGDHRRLEGDGRPSRPRARHPRLVRLEGRLIETGLSRGLSAGRNAKVMVARSPTTMVPISQLRPIRRLTTPAWDPQPPCTSRALPRVTLA